MTRRNRSFIPGALLLGLVLALAMLVPSGCGGGSGTGSGGGRIVLPQSALLSKIADAVNTDRMMEDITYMASPELKGRPAGSAQNEELAGYIEKEFRDLGLEPFSALGLTGLRQDFQVPSSRCFLENPPATEQVLTMPNVIGIIPGTSQPDIFVVLMANFDGLGIDAQTGEYYPGADYNASGAGAVLELARVISAAGEKPPVTLVFAELNAEECGYYGSRALADALEKQGMTNAVRMINLEGLGGGAGDYMDIWDQNYKKNRPAVEAVNDAAAFLDVTLEINGTGSGSASSLFFLYHMACVTCDWSWYERSEHANFHRVSDTADIINRTGLTDVTRVTGIAAWLLGIYETD
jgi:aminopeptidase N